MQAPENGIYQLLLEAATAVPESSFFLDGNRSVSYADALTTTNKVAAYLKIQGIQAGDRVLLNVGNTPEFLYAVLAIAQLGAISVLTNPVAGRFELQHYVNESEPKLVLTFSGRLEQFKIDNHSFVSKENFLLIDKAEGYKTFWESINEAEPQSDWNRPEVGEAAVIMYTAAEDGTPSGAVICHDALYEVSTVFAESVLENDVFIAALPLFHSFGFVSTFLIPLRSRVPFHLLGNFTPQSLVDSLRTHDITIFTGTPVMFLAIEKRLQLEIGRLSTRLWICGGEALPIDLQKRFKQQLGIDIRVGYGLTETSSIATFNSPAHKNKIGAAGKQMPWNEIKIVRAGREMGCGQIGEILIKGTNVISHYFKRDQKTGSTISDGWLRSGDLGYLDSDGNLYISGRKKKMIIKSGLNIYPKEVEKLIKKHPQVIDVKIFTYEIESIDNAKAETSEAVVTVSEQSELNEKALKKWCRENISSYKVPDRLVCKYI